MNHNQILRDQRTSTLVANVVPKANSVKGQAHKIARILMGLFVYSALFLGMQGAVHAEEVNAKAIVNSTQLLNFLDGVVPDGLPHILENIQNGKVRRIAPAYPVWIMDSTSGKVLYYQGQKDFVGQAATRLVDDSGFRFGQRALDMAKNSRSTWVKLQLSGKDYRAYCGSKAPYVVCSLVQ